MATIEELTRGAPVDGVVPGELGTPDARAESGWASVVVGLTGLRCRNGYSVVSPIS